MLHAELAAPCSSALLGVSGITILCVRQINRTPPMLEWLESQPCPFFLQPTDDAGTPHNTDPVQAHFNDIDTPLLSTY